MQTKCASSNTTILIYGNLLNINHKICFGALFTHQAFYESLK